MDNKYRQLGRHYDNLYLRRRQLNTTMQPIYRGMTQTELDRAYDNRAFVADSAQCLARWAETSAEFYRTTPVHKDLRYGPASRQRLDFFPAGPIGRPTLLFIHGGYWQWCNKEDEAFIGRGPLAHHINLVNVEYTLCPETSIDGIVDEIDAALDWLVPRLAEFDADPQQLIIGGSSAGAHLAATTLGRPEVKGALLISGIYDLEPIRLSRLNQVLRLDLPTARRNSPLLHRPVRSLPICLATGADELPEMIRQTQDYYDAWEADRSFCLRKMLSGVNHFTIMDELARPDGRLTEALLQLLQLF
jgi:acetyl esterase/lipase